MCAGPSTISLVNSPKETTMPIAEAKICPSYLQVHPTQYWLHHSVLVICDTLTYLNCGFGDP
jgi:hypothetical protein